MIKAPLVVMACVLVTGCAYRPMVSIDALAGNNSAQYKSYILIDANKNSSPLEFEQYADQIKRTLQELGFTQVSGKSKPDFIAALTTTVGPKNTTTSLAVTPTYGVIRTETQSTGHVSGDRYREKTTSTPIYGVTGSRYYQVTDEYYPLGFSIAAVRTDEKKTPIWQITASIQAATPDLRRHFGIMLQTAVPYIGKDTKGLIRVRAQPIE